MAAPAMKDAGWPCLPVEGRAVVEGTVPGPRAQSAFPGQGVPDAAAGYLQAPPELCAFDISERPITMIVIKVAMPARDPPSWTNTRSPTKASMTHGGARRVWRGPRLTRTLPGRRGTRGRLSMTGDRQNPRH